MAPLTSVMDRNGETLFTPVVELLLLTRRRRFTGPDEDFLPGEEFRTWRINRLSQHVDMPAFVGKTGRFQPQMRTVVALPPNQQRILTCFFATHPGLQRQTQSGHRPAGSPCDAPYSGLVHSLPHRGDDVIYQNIHRMVTAELADFGAQFCRAGIAQNG